MEIDNIIIISMKKYDTKKDLTQLLFAGILIAMIWGMIVGIQWICDLII